jgi:hypothetical protein
MLKERVKFDALFTTAKDGAKVESMWVQKKKC